MKTNALRNSVAMGPLVFALSVLAVGCKQEVTASGQAANPTASSKTRAANSKITKIVFIGKKNACDCTRKRVDDSFAALRTALGDHPDMAIEQLQVDVDQESVVHYQKLRPIMVLPAIYLLEGSGALVDVLQGEVTTEQIANVLQTKKVAQ
jgi:hypothetical protein